MQELICSCEDVVPPIEQQPEAQQQPRADDDYDADVYVKDAGNSNMQHTSSNNNNDNDTDDTDERVPNAMALLQTVSALIALDANPHHQQLHHLHNPQHHDQPRRQQQSVVEHLEHEHFSEPTTCSQQQEQMLQIENVLYENGVSDDVGVEDCGEESLGRGQKATVGQMLLRAKQKTYEKIKQNLLSAHGQHSFHSANNNNRTLHTIVENEHDVAAAGPAGHYHVIDEKEQQLEKCESPKEKSSNKEAISKRIEFFEQQRNGKQKLEVFSIYLPKEKEKQLEQKIKTKTLEAGATLLKHDSHTLTVILSCVFIATFLWLVFFPLPG